MRDREWGMGRQTGMDQQNRAMGKNWKVGFKEILHPSLVGAGRETSLLLPCLYQPPPRQPRAKQPPTFPAYSPLQGTNSIFWPGHSQLLGVIEEFEPHIDEARAGRQAGAILRSQKVFWTAALWPCLSFGQALNVKQMLKAGFNTTPSSRLPCGVSPTFTSLFSLLIITLYCFLGYLLLTCDLILCSPGHIFCMLHAGNCVAFSNSVWFSHHWTLMHRQNRPHGPRFPSMSSYL